MLLAQAAELNTVMSETVQYGFAGVLILVIGIGSYFFKRQLDAASKREDKYLAMQTTMLDKYADLQRETNRALIEMSNALNTQAKEINALTKALQKT